MQKKTVAILSVSAVALVAVVAALAVGLTQRGTRTHTSDDDISTSTNAVKAICERTAYKDVCERSLIEAGRKTADPKELIKSEFQAAMKEINVALQNSTALKESEKDPKTLEGLKICMQCLKLAIDQLQDSFDKFVQFQTDKVDDYIEDLKTWISGAISYKEMCLESMEDTPGNAREHLAKVLLTAGRLTANSLDMVAEIKKLLGSFGIQVSSSSSSSRRLLSTQRNIEGFPDWVDASKRKLLQQPSSQIKPDIVVAQDGSGQYTTLTDALKNVPVRPDNRVFVIYVKQGVYKEMAVIDRQQTHIMLIGDGQTKTIFTGNKNFIDGVGTYDQACVIVLGSGFIAKDIGFENTAGPEKHQAVALRVDADFSVFYHCQFDGFQDTLLTAVNRQFFRDCTITGTVDFIFGRSFAVFQNCLILVRKGTPGQQCFVTAHGRDVDQQKENSAIVIQNCNLQPTPELRSATPKSEIYLGRPWKPFAQTIVMQSSIDGYFNPQGWYPWDPRNTSPSSNEQTCFYAEYGNRGAGLSLNGRVTWKGYHKIDANTAASFTPGRYLSGDSWIPKTGVPYISGMV